MRSRVCFNLKIYVRFEREINALSVPEFVGTKKERLAEQRVHFSRNLISKKYTRLYLTPGARLDVSWKRE